MTDRYARSRTNFDQAKRSLAGGVATAFRTAQLPVPITFESGHGAHLTDVDGNEYVDYALGFGPLLLGHSPAPVLEAMRRQLDRGLGFGASHPLEKQLAEAVCRTVPSAELCIFSSTGTEAVQAAIRVARTATQRNRIVKFLGHYHGWADSVYVGVSPQTAHLPATGGEDPAASTAVTVCPWNDIEALASVLSDDVAGVIMEPAAINCGGLTPGAGYLEAVRDMTTRSGSILIFDEVITGYRLGLGGAQELYGVLPDLTVLGKALGSGLPISAVCGRADVMKVVADGRVGHVGTFNANPICASAALAAVEEFEKHASELYPKVSALGRQLAGLLMAAGRGAGIPITVNQIGAAAYAFASSEPVKTYLDTLNTDEALYRRFAQALLDEGVHVIPRGLLYVSAAHTEADLEFTYEAAKRAASRVARDLELATTGARRDVS